MEIKEQFKQDEELIVKIFKLERFFKKYKVKILVVTGLVVAGGLGWWGYNLYQLHRQNVANQLFYRLTHGEENPKLVTELREYSKSLYDLYLLHTSNPENWRQVTTFPLVEIAQYKLALNAGTIKGLERYLYNPQYHLLKDNIRYLLIYLYLKKGNRKRSLTLFREITDPKIKDSAKLLLHYGILKG